MVDLKQLEQAWAPVPVVLGSLQLPPEQLSAAESVCRRTMWGVVPSSELVLRLNEEAGLELEQALDTFKRLHAAVWPQWRQLWRQLEEQQRELGRSELAERFERWRESVEVELEVRRPQLESQAGLALTLQQSLDADSRWDAVATIAHLAHQNRLVQTVWQSRALRDEVASWLAGAATGRGASTEPFSPPEPERWSPALISLLLEYLLVVRLGWRGEDSAVLASVIGRYLAEATGDHSFATLAHGDEPTGQFVWRAVRFGEGGAEFE